MRNISFPIVGVPGEIELHDYGNGTYAIEVFDRADGYIIKGLNLEDLDNLIQALKKITFQEDI